MTRLLDINPPLPTLMLMTEDGDFIQYRFDEARDAEGAYKTLRALFHANGPKDGWYLELQIDGQSMIEDHLPPDPFLSRNKV